MKELSSQKDASPIEGACKPFPEVDKNKGKEKERSEYLYTLQIVYTKT